MQGSDFDEYFGRGIVNFVQKYCDLTNFRQNIQSLLYLSSKLRSHTNRKFPLKKRNATSKVHTMTKINFFVCANYTYGCLHFVAGHQNRTTSKRCRDTFSEPRLNKNSPPTMTEKCRRRRMWQRRRLLKCPPPRNSLLPRNSLFSEQFFFFDNVCERRVS